MISTDVRSKFQTWILSKSEKDIDYLQSILADELSMQTLQQVVKCYQTGKVGCLKPVYEACCAEEEKKEQEADNNYRFCQYFPVFLHLSAHESFIDGGGYTGNSTYQFVKNTQAHFDKIHIFEPGKEIYEDILLFLKREKIDSEKIITHNVGLYSSTKEASFQLQGDGTSHIDENGNTIVKFVKLDDYLSEKERSEITYIKLDIEGAEMDALEGMKETISKYKPKLAIAIYHFMSDLWKIPLFIYQLNPNYKLYIRQYSFVSETICYAI